MSDEEVPGPAPSADVFGSLTAEEQAQLSRCLFPSEDTKDVVVLGKTRELRPLPIKWARKLKVSIQPLVTEISKGFDETTAGTATEDFDAEGPILNAIEKATLVLADFYGWQDVKEAMAGDGLSLGEQQTLAAVQVNVNGNNDFLLGGLRSVVRWMQISEMMTHRFQNMLTGPLS